jgi:hypothetical protein
MKKGYSLMDNTKVHRRIHRSVGTPHDGDLLFKKRWNSLCHYSQTSTLTRREARSRAKLQSAT